MNIEELVSLGRDCYAAFNQAMPDPSARTWALWAELCAEVPLAAAPWIRSRVIDQDGMPRNFGKAVKDLGREWRTVRAAGGRPGAKAGGCPECDAGTPGFFTVWDISRGEPHAFVAQCACSHGPRPEGMMRLTRARAAANGWLFPGPGESGASFAAALAARSGMGGAPRGGRAPVPGGGAFGLARGDMPAPGHGGHGWNRNEHEKESGHEWAEG